MDRATRDALDALHSVARESPPPAPVRLSARYLRAIERAEALPANQSGTDKSWTEQVLADWTRAVRGARRLPRE